MLLEPGSASRIPVTAAAGAGEVSPCLKHINSFVKYMVGLLLVWWRSCEAEDLGNLEVQKARLLVALCKG
jgi:hypothetical protein